MDTHKNLIVVKGEVKTKDILECHYNKDTKKCDIQFQNGKKYSYAYGNVIWLREPILRTPSMYRISRAGKEFFRIQAIYQFQNYWHICFEDGSERDYEEKELEIKETCLTDKASKNVFQYLKQISALSELTNENNERILKKLYEKIDYIGKDTVLSYYLNPVQASVTTEKRKDVIPIFPFGCNQSQYKAVKKALENKVSVIQGPPGTGKTQTILNIIANILIEGKTVQVVSNNNSATENVREKLASPKYELGFLVAALGKAENKASFIEQQSGRYPQLDSWKIEDGEVSLESVKTEAEQLQQVFEKREELAQQKQNLAQVEVEWEYFKQYVKENQSKPERMKTRKKLSNASLMELWQICQTYAENGKRPGVLFKIKNSIRYGITDWKFYKQNMMSIITSIQEEIYLNRLQELRDSIENLDSQLSQMEKEVSTDLLSRDSMKYLRNVLVKKYGTKRERKVFSQDDLWKNPQEVLREYPVILSTTFSSRSSLGKEVIYDYLIMDEASQVDVATGALALSCAKNVVIVGDTKQLPNIVTKEVNEAALEIFESFNINEGYQFTKSFLQSVLEVFPEAPQTLLREHYRCHPKIIHFCNQKFYNGELVIMTEDNGEKDVLSVIKTVPGNHERQHYSQRQIDVVKEEVLPRLKGDLGETGIITPYKHQVEEIQKQISQVEVATVHKFQGKEKDTIIMSTVDDEITEFTDDPYLINVAVSRAKKKLCLIVSGNEQPADKNISDLVSYIEYQNFEVRESKVYSVFDFLYQQYTEKRQAYLRSHRRVSDYDSENLMYALISDILKMEKWKELAVVCHQSLNMLIKTTDLLTEEEKNYMMNPATHLDFLIYNKVCKKPVLAVEVDGYRYHKSGTKQSQRDEMKNHILELYGIPLMRFQTNGSLEREKLIKKLSEVVA